MFGKDKVPGYLYNLYTHVAQRRRIKGKTWWIYFLSGQVKEKKTCKYLKIKRNSKR